MIYQAIIIHSILKYIIMALVGLSVGLMAKHYRSMRSELELLDPDIARTYMSGDRAFWISMGLVTASYLVGLLF